MSLTTTGESAVEVRVEGNGPASLEKLRQILARDRIRSAARAVLFRRTEGDRIVAFLNKQVAYAGHVSFCDPVGESPLGPIRLEIDSDDLTRVIEWLTGGEKERKER